MKVYVVVNLELGWDNIVGVFEWSKFTEDEILERFPRDDMYVVFEKDVEENLSDYE